MAKATKKKEKNLPLEKTLWLTADKLRKNLDSSEYIHIVLGVIFLKYTIDIFEDMHQKLLKAQGHYADADAEDAKESRSWREDYMPVNIRSWRKNDIEVVNHLRMNTSNNSHRDFITKNQFRKACVSTN